MASLRKEGLLTPSPLMNRLSFSFLTYGITMGEQQNMGLSWAVRTSCSGMEIMKSC